MKLLSDTQIKQKIKRLSIEILEENYDEKEIILAGINNNGMSFAQKIYDEITPLTEIRISLTRISLSPANPLEREVIVETPLEELENKVVIIVDDVGNTGRTLFYACKPLMNILPKKVEMAVLVDRKHKSFPVKVDYVGVSLATTLQENIHVEIRDVEEMAVYLR